MMSGEDFGVLSPISNGCWRWWEVTSDLSSVHHPLVPLYCNFYAYVSGLSPLPWRSQRHVGHPSPGS